MATLDSNKVTGVSVVSNATDAVSKEYVDNLVGSSVPPLSGNQGKFLNAGLGGGTYWILRTSGFGTNTINTITFGNNLYLAGGAVGSVLWTQRTSGFGTSIISALMYDGTNYFAAGAGGTLTTSTDTITWTYRTSGTTNHIGIDNQGGGTGLLYASGQTQSYVYCGSFSGAANGILASSTDAIAWTLRTSGVTQGLIGVTYGALPTPTYLWAGALQAGGAIGTSTDAISWTLRTSGSVTAAAIRSLLYSEATTERYILGRASGVIQTSTNAIEWTTRTSGTTQTLHQILYGGVYVVSGAAGVIITSTNATVWTLRTSGTTSILYGLAYTSGSYVASGLSGVSLYSTDAITWMPRASGFGTSGIYYVTYGGGIFINALQSLTTSTPNRLSSTGDGAGIYVSTDTISWIARTTPSGMETSSFLASGNNSYVSYNLDYDGFVGSIIASSDNIIWQLRTTGFSVSNTGDLTYYNNNYLLSNSDNEYFAPINWTLRTSGFGTSIISALMYDGTNYFAGGSLFTLTTSTDLITWTYRTAGTTGVNQFMNELYYTSGKSEPYIYVGAFGKLATSTNSIEWTIRTTTNTLEIYSIVYGDLPTPTYAIANINMLSGTISTSTDAISWVARTTGINNADIYRLTYSTATPEYYVNCGANARIQTSTDSIVWTTRTSPYFSNYYDIIYTDKYVVVGESIVTSTDAIIWTLRTSSLLANQFIETILYESSSGIYLAEGFNSYSATSTDAIVWTLRTTSGTIYSSIYANNNFIQGGSLLRTATVSDIPSGQFITASMIASTDTITWQIRTLPFSNKVIKFASNTSSLIGSFVDGTGNYGIVFSTDSINWVLRTSGFGTTQINTLVVGSSYVAAGNSGVLWSSTDSITWILRTSGTTSNLSSSAVSGYNEYIVSGASGVSLYSTDTITWILRTSGFGSSAINSVTYGNNIFVNAGASGTLSASNALGLMWESLNDTTTLNLDATYKGSQEFTTSGAQTFYIPPTATQFYIEAIGAGGGGSAGRYITSPGSGSGGGSGAYTAWLIRRGELGNASTITVTPGTGGIGGQNNRGMSTSTDGIVYTQRPSGFGASTIFTLMYDGTNYFAAGAGGALITSTDGETWTYRTSGRTTQIGYATGGNGLLYAAGQTELYVYAGASGVLASSTNSIQWRLRTSASATTAIQALAFGALPTATYVRANATAGNIATSTNAIQWTLRTTGNTTNIIQALLYSTGPIGQTEYYVNVRAGGALQTSTNAIEWTSRTSGTTQTLHQIIYGGVYATCGFNGIINTSTNAIEWTLRTSGAGQTLYGLAYNPSAIEKYIAAGASGVVVSSTDAIVWTLRTSLFQPASVQSVTYGSIFVAGGVVGTNSGTNGTNTTVTWTGNTPTGTATYTLTSAAGFGAADNTIPGSGGAATAETRNPIYATAGLAGGAGLSAAGAGNNSTQSNSNQVTGGGSGAYDANDGGSGLTYYYGNTYTNGGSSSGGNGSDGIPGSYTGNIGGGGGGGGASASLAGNGGNGTRGGGGGGGGYSSSTRAFGVGGSGGDGYVRITWW
jgi:hypothetical protein